MASNGKFSFPCEFTDSNDEDPLVICDPQNNSVNLSVKDEFEYKVDSHVQYRLLDSATTESTLRSQSFIREMSTNTVPEQTTENSNGIKHERDEVLTSLQRNRPCVIYPKGTMLSNYTPSEQTQNTLPVCKRDEKRRATHNEVERRRRDKINYLIDKLRLLLPEEKTRQRERPTTRTTNDSKSGILKRACHYIKNKKDEVENLTMCLTKVEGQKLKEINDLKAEIEKLRLENSHLKELLSYNDKSKVEINNSSTSS